MNFYRQFILFSINDILVFQIFLQMNEHQLFVHEIIIIIKKELAEYFVAHEFGFQSVIS